MTSKESLNNLYVNISLINNETIRDKSFEDLETIRKDLEVLELLKQRIKPDIFGRLCYVPILEERDRVYKDFESEKIWEWVKR